VARPGIILQARFGSTRLPGKALETIRSQTVLAHCLRRLLARRDAAVILATTAGPEDDALDQVAEDLGVPVFRGDSDDVLGRYVGAAFKFRVDPIIRATGDNPAVDMDAAWRVLRALGDSGADYVAEEGLPLGAGVEGMTFAALRRAAMAAHDPYDREHVTTYLKGQPQAFRILVRQAPAPLCRPDLRLTVDTAEDLEYVRGLFDAAETDLPTLSRLIEAAGPNAAREVA
jgi:spore coat polysaccharide biosynthesis protein SpsF